MSDLYTISAGLIQLRANSCLSYRVMPRAIKRLEGKVRMGTLALAILVIAHSISGG